MDEQDPKKNFETVGVGEFTAAGDINLAPRRRRNIPLVMLLQGEMIGKKFQLRQRETVIGRTPDCDIVLSDFEISRRHAQFIYENLDKPDEAPRCMIQDLDSKNGTCVNGERIKIQALRDKDIISMGAVVLGFYFKDEIEVKFDTQMYSMATVDSLTGVHNKHYFQRELQQEISRAKRSGSPLTLILFDIDHFKQINDTDGHLAGDAILGKMGEILLANVREYDICARYGGDEFAIILPSTSLEDSLVVAERIHRAVQTQTFAYQSKKIPLTISVGIARLEQDLNTADDLIRSVDAALYESKAKGRNCITARK